MFAAILFSSTLQEGLNDLIERLGSDRVEERDEATRRLKERGPAALPELSLRAADPDPEVRARVRRLCLVIEIRGALGPKILERMPGIDERLAEGDWTQALDAAGTLRSPPLNPEEVRALYLQASAAARKAGQAEDFCRRLPALILSGTLVADEQVRAPVELSVRCFGHSVGVPVDVRWTRAIRLAVIGDRALREGDVLPEFNAEVHRIWPHGVELRPLDDWPRSP